VPAELVALDRNRQEIPRMDGELFPHGFGQDNPSSLINGNMTVFHPLNNTITIFKWQLLFLTLFPSKKPHFLSFCVFRACRAILSVVALAKMEASGVDECCS
jgi:hypothetical protein